jgi:hypothetical protein
MEEQYGELELEILAASAELLQTDALQLQVDAMLSGKRAPALSLWQKDALLVAADALLVAAEKKKKENKGEKKKMNQNYPPVQLPPALRPDAFVAVLALGLGLLRETLLRHCQS